MNANEIISLLPYGPGFHFVDELSVLSPQQVIGKYRFRETASFYEHHFPGHPVTPGVILTECLAQIGLLAWGIYLLDQAGKQWSQEQGFALVASNVKFLHPVFPGEEVQVMATQEYFRFGKLKVQARMQNEAGQTVCSGTLSGMMKSKRL